VLGALIIASASATAMVVVDKDGQYWDCNYDRGQLVCVPLDYMPPLDP